MKTLSFGSMALTAFLLIVGCDSKSATHEKKSVPTEKQPETPATDAKSGEGHDWWCDEHGVKEAECSMCSVKVAKERKRNGELVRRPPTREEPVLPLRSETRIEIRGGVHRQKREATTGTDRAAPREEVIAAPYIFGVR